MGKMIRDLIEYNGIDTCSYKSVTNFKQMNTDFIFCVPDVKPNIEQVVKVWASACVLDTQIVNTPVGTSYEGYSVSGYKLLVNGEMSLKMQYVACNEKQSVHTAHTTYPFSGYIVLPSNLNPSAIITPSIIIEDIFTNQIDCRCVYNNITMMLIAYSC